MNRLVLLLAVVCASTLPAADFWQTKKFPDWNQKEVEKLLKDSPWAQTFSVETGKARSSNPSRGGGMSSGGTGGGGMSGGSRGGRSGGGGGMRMPSGSDSPQPQAAASSTVLLRWLSALPVKHALARAQYGDEAATSPDAVRSFERQETQYTVVLMGLPPRLVRKGDQMKNNAVLKIKGQDPITAADAKAELRQNIVYLTLFFPKEGHALKPEDGELALELKLGNQTVTRKFKLKNMIYNGKLEI